MNLNSGDDAFRAHTKSGCTGSFSSNVRSVLSEGSIGRFRVVIDDDTIARPYIFRVALFLDILRKFCTSRHGAHASACSSTCYIVFHIAFAARQVGN